jgi:hypothetical protein
MSIEILKEILQDADVFGFIGAGAYADAYDREAQFILDYLSKDLSIEQIQNIIWHAFYQECCICQNSLTNEPWMLDTNQAMFIIGDPERFKDLAYMIRHSVLSL